MASKQLLEMVVEYAGKRGSSLSPSTSASSASSGSSSASSSGAPTTSSGPSKMQKVRRYVKTKKFIVNSSRRPMQKLAVGKKSRKGRASATKMWFVKYKIDKQHKEMIAESQARIEEFNRRREELRAGQGEIAQLCRDVTTAVAAARQSYERRRPAIFQSVLSRYLEQQYEALYDDEEGFMGPY